MSTIGLMGKAITSMPLFKDFIRRCVGVVRAWAPALAFAVLAAATGAVWLAEGSAEVPPTWPSFRGPQASGVGDGMHPPIRWNGETGEGILWKTLIPGLGHSSPIIAESTIYITTAISSDPNSEFRPGLYGDIASAKDVSNHRWLLYAIDLATGAIVWEAAVLEGIPRTARHTKSSFASPTPATDGTRIVVSFGSQGLYCYDLTGNLIWKRDLGTINSGYYRAPGPKWGYGSSPVIHGDRVVIQCDALNTSYIAAFDLESGKEIWRTPRAELPSWSTPTIYEGPRRTQVLTNGSKFARSYDLETGEEIWRLGPNSDIPVPTPVVAGELVYLTSSHGIVRPIYAVRLDSTGDVSLRQNESSSAQVAWSQMGRGTYIPTPIVYGDLLYVCTDNGVIRSFEALTGKPVFQKRLGTRGGAVSASSVAADGHIYFSTEEGDVYVIAEGRAGREVSVNPMGEPIMATPAFARGMIVIRTQSHLFGIGAIQ